MGRDGILDPYKRTLVDIAVKQAMTALIKRASWLSLPIINPVASWMLTKTAMLLLEKTILQINLYMIEVDTNRSVKGIKEGLDQIKALPPEAKEEKDAIENKIIGHSRDLIKFRDRRRL